MLVCLFMFCQEGCEVLGFSLELVMLVMGNKVVIELFVGICDCMGNLEYNKVKEVELLYDSKEVFEYIFFVKEVIVELEVVCLLGSVVVEDLMLVCQCGSVQYLGFGVSGQFVENKDVWDVFIVLFLLIIVLGIFKNVVLNVIM